MNLRRLRFGDWVMGIGGVAVLAVMFMDWYEPAQKNFLVLCDQRRDECRLDLLINGASAWQAFTVTDVIVALAGAMATAAFVLALTQPTPAVPLAVASLTALLAILVLALVTVRVIVPPDLTVLPGIDTARATGAWLGLVATAVLAGGALASIRDERVAHPEHTVEPRLVSP
jgi:hypothetical protein